MTVQRTKHHRAALPASERRDLAGALHTIVIPVFNEELGVHALHERVAGVADKLIHLGKFEIIYVNDGSRDRSGELLDAIALRDPRARVLHFSRNFGHQMAITAGLEWASGHTVTVMDADLQDPPELIEAFIGKWCQGYDVVFGTRETRVGETWFKLATAKLFYRLIRRMTNVEIPVDTGDFRLMDRCAVDALASLPERHRFVRGLVSWVGFKQVGVPYARDARRFGDTHYPFRKMLRFALDGLTSFSIIPLQMATWVGFLAALAAFVGIGITIYYKFCSNLTIPGWSSLMLVVLFLGGVQLMALGVIGEYLGRTYDESRRRPLYLLSRVVGFPE